MNYINAGKRDILIFPKFKEIEKIQEIRNRYDELASIIPPHITLGTIDEIDANIDLKETFETIVDNIIVESIGENEESIIEFKIEL